jgi:hypothetical protein
MATVATLDAIRAAIAEALAAFRVRPFYNLRESDPQSCLLLAIRHALGDQVVPALLTLEKGARHAHSEDVQTSRVHTELKIEKTLVSDIVVFRDDRRVRLRCYPAGPCDVVATIDGDDIDVVIEIKAAPSSSQTKTFVKDLQKLSTLRVRHPHIHPMFVLFDKSLPAAGARGTARYDWLTPISSPTQVEIYYLDDTGRFRTTRV